MGQEPAARTAAGEQAPGVGGKAEAGDGRAFIGAQGGAPARDDGFGLMHRDAPELHLVATERRDGGGALPMGGVVGGARGHGAQRGEHGRAGNDEQSDAEER